MKLHLPPSKRCLSFIACAFILSLTNNAFAWWNRDWTIRKKIDIDTSNSGASISDQIGTAAILLRLHDGNFRFADATDDGRDLRFVASDDKTLLTYHIEKYDALLNEAFVWVKVPDLKPGTKTSLWMYYGNLGTKATAANDPKGSYDENTVLVYHFAENNAPPRDSTSYGNHAQTTAIPTAGALIGPGVLFSGNNGVIIPKSGSLAWPNAARITWSAWVKPVAAQPTGILFSRRDGADGFVIGTEGGRPFVEVVDASSPQRGQATAPISPDAWHHLAVVADGSNVTLYLDGQSVASLSGVLPALNSDATLGADTLSGNVGFSGEMDELEISKIARPAGFIKVAALGQGGDKASRLLAFGNEETKSSWFSGGYVGVILRSLTVDGWLVICVLIVMSAVSWVVMVNKARYLTATTKGNAQFFRDWNHVAADLSFLDDRDPRKVISLGGRIDSRERQIVKFASVYRIYKIGAEEIRHRLAMEGAAESHLLSARSIQAIRAALDGGLVRETQKLHRLLVLLTIAISGGPFLGLLGTVVGVMITFAAIAAQGDVNVNAIAPGIAGALAATVAGLAVAIPALFGYNYLVSRVKDITSDMHVFIDEFVTKIAEYYGGQGNRSNPQRHHGAPEVVELEMIA